jgi:histidine triad (HIT) family protein
MLETDCPFCEIAAGLGESSIVYADDRVLAFMTLHPTRPGECLVVPRDHIDHFTDIPDELAAHIMLVGQKIGRRMRQELSPLRVGMIVHGFGVAHAHLILVPQHHPNDIVSGRHAYLDKGEIRFGVQHLPTPPRSELDAMASRLTIADQHEPASQLTADR